MDYKIKDDGKFKYLEEGEGEVIVLLHGLFGALSNFKDLFEHSRSYVESSIEAFIGALCIELVGKSAIYCTLGLAGGLNKQLGKGML